MQDALRRFSPVYLPDNGARDDASTRSWIPLANISESEKEYLIKCELPDVKKEDVKIAVADGVITISGERKLEREHNSENAIRLESFYGAFTRSFVLPDNVDAIPQREPLAGIRGNRCIERRVPDRNTR